ncbi:MAG: carboxypeptidase regulatory-like domain-containing protein [Bacteroidota bacterium]
MRHLLRSSFLLLAFTFSISIFGQNLLSKANKQYEFKAYNRAISNYLKVLAVDDKEPQALAGLADCYRMLNKMDEAANWFSKAVQVAGIDPVHFLNYGKVLMAQGKYEDAKIWFKTYAASDPVMGNHFLKSCDYALSMRGKPATFRVYKEYLNTINSDFGPAFFGDYIVYSSSRTDIKRSKKKNQSKDFSEGPNNQLYITSTDQNGYLRTPTLLQSDLTNNYNEGPVTYSPDGEWVIFTKNTFENGVRQVPEAGATLSMYMAEVDGNGNWKNVKALPFNRNGYSSGYPAFSANGKVLYFASNREGGFGGWDLYSAFKTADGWSVPQNLGETINTPGDEISPYVDGQTMYFSSDYHTGLGGMDIFKAKKTNGNWNEVYHLGNTVNSSYDDYGFIFTAEENRGYFVTNRKGVQGGEDIYKVKKMTDNFVITVVNESNMRPVAGAIVDFSDCDEPNFETDIDGKYVFEALEGLGCDVIIRKDGFKPYALNIKSLGQRLTRTYEVKLRRMADEFVGKIVDSESNESVEGVVIKATNRKTGLTQRVTSNKWGEYKLALDAPDQYTIRYSKAGYINTHKKVTVTSKTDKSLLGVLSFAQSYSTGSVGGTVTESTDDDMVIPELDNVPDDPMESYDEEIAAPKGYAVQVAAYFDGRPIEVNKYSNLQEIGNVYKMKEGKAEKVRVGIFESKKEAESARKTITQKGYAKAFVVSEEGRQNFQLRIQEEEENPKGDDRLEDYEDTNTERIEVPQSEYKIRVATFKSTSKFDETPLTDFGEVEMRKSGKYTIILLSGFRSASQAKMTHDQIVKMGYKDAFLVMDDGENLKRVN